MSDTTPPGVRRLVHEVVEELADRTPDAIALICGAERLSYAGLDARAARLAARLAEAGVRRGSLVGVFLGRGIDLTAAALAALKAGAGYVTLDPELPADRLSRMAADAGISVLVSHGASADASPFPGIPFVPVEDVEGAQRLPRGAVAVSPEDLACVMFTSGSTGYPKASATPHRAITGTLLGQRYLPDFPDFVWLQMAAVSWDGFVLELWGTLLRGGTSVIYPPGSPNPLELARLVATHSVTAMLLPSSLFHVIVDEYPDLLKPVRHLIVGGEAPSPVHIGRLLARGQDLRIENVYGPVEGVIGFTSQTVTAAHAELDAVPIGRELAGKSVYVLDDRLQPVPDGRVGELYAAGVGTAHGYLGRPDLTAERFVPNPFGPPGDRMYRTGDRGSRDAGGTFHFAGRVDDQVKIRGHRIEPGEVEAVLARHPDVDRVAVLAATDQRGEKFLVGYVVPRGGRTRWPGEAALHRAAAASLPEPMIPAAFVVLDTMPLTANGKLDRANLPAPPGPGSGPAEPLEPRTEPERVLCAVFADVLGMDRVSPADDFFALGGDSRKLTRLLSRARAQGLELSARAVLETPTPAALARATALRSAAADDSPGQPGSHGFTATDLSFAQSRLWVMDQINADAAYTMPILYRFDGRVEPEPLRLALRDLVARHDSLRTMYFSVDGEPAARVVDAAAARPELRVVELPSAELERGIRLAGQHRFALDRELPIHAVLFVDRDREDVSVLLIVTHHIATDGWSIRPMMSDLSAAYAARLRGAAPELPPAALGYADYARLQREALGDPDDPESRIADELAYLCERLADLSEGTRLPRRPDRPAVTGSRAGYVTRRIDAAGHAGLLAAGRRNDATLFMMLQAALAVTLRRAGAGDAIAVGAPVAGRTVDHPGIDDLVGFLVNLVVLRADLAGDLEIGSLLRQVRDDVLDALSSQDVPFDRVVEALNPSRLPGRNPLVDVVLSLQNTAHAELDLGGVPGRRAHVDLDAARFELSVNTVDDYTPRKAPDGISVTLEYHDEVFDRPVMEWFADTFLGVLGQLASREPTDRISSLILPEPPVDVAALAAASAPTRPAAAPARAAAAPRTPLEGRLAAIVGEVLGLEEFSIHDDFFTLGADSLRAIRIAARIATAERLPATAAAVFAAPTVAELARELAGREQPTAATAIPTVPRIARAARRAAI